MLDDTFGSLVPIEAQSLSKLCDSYGSLIQDTKERKIKAIEQIAREEMAKPRWFGLVKGNVNPSQEEVDNYINADEHFSFLIKWEERRHEDRLDYQKSMRLAAGSAEGTILLSIDDLAKLKGGY